MQAQLTIVLFFCRLSIQSDPVVQFYDPVVICSLCGETGHSKKSCHYSKAADRSNMSYEDVVFWSYIDPRDRPDSLREEDSDGDDDTSNLENSPEYQYPDSDESDANLELDDDFGDSEMEEETSGGLEAGNMEMGYDSNMEVESVTGSLVSYDADTFEDSDSDPDLYEDSGEASDQEDEADFNL